MFLLFSIVFLWFSQVKHQFPMVSHSFLHPISMFLNCSYCFPIVFLVKITISHGFPMGVPYEVCHFPMVFPWICPCSSGFPMGFPMAKTPHVRPGALRGGLHWAAAHGLAPGEVGLDDAQRDAAGCATVKGRYPMFITWIWLSLDKSLLLLESSLWY